MVLFDFRGCGRSSRGLPDEHLQPEYVAHDTHLLIEKLGLGAVDLVGFSTGGRAAMQFVDRYPEQVRRLVLASTSAYPSADAEPYLADWSEEAAISGRMHPWCPGDPEQILRTCGKPILILHGEKDMGFPVQLAHRLHRAVPSDLAVIPDTAHMCHFEQSTIWAHHLHIFLTSGRQ